MQRNQRWVSILSVWLFVGLMEFNGVALADRFKLWINYVLPTDPDLIHDAQHLEADALTHRNIEIQACANGSDRNACERQAEIAFRRRISAIPGARFRLCYSPTSSPEEIVNAPWLMDLSSDEVVDEDLNQALQHLKPESRWVLPLGVDIDTNGCRLIVSHQAWGTWVSYQKAEFTEILCRMVGRNLDAKSLFLDLIDEGQRFAPDLLALEFLLNHGVNANVKSAGDVPALAEAVQKNELDVVKLLITKGADVNSRDYLSKTPLYYTDESSLDVVRFLVEHGAKVDVTDEFGATPLITTTVKGRADIAEYLVSSGSNVDTRDPVTDQTPLMIAAQFGYIDMMNVFLKHNASINAVGREGSALIYATAGGNVEAVKLLLDHGVSVNLRSDYFKATALTIAKKFGYDEIERILLQHGGTQ